MAGTHRVPHPPVFARFNEWISIRREGEKLCPICTATMRQHVSGVCPTCDNCGMTYMFHTAKGKCTVGKRFTRW